MVVEEAKYTDIYGLMQIYSCEDEGATRTLTPESGSVIGNRHWFQGREWDPEAGVYQFRHRAMDPASGRFVQRDPVGPGEFPSSAHTAPRPGNRPSSCGGGIVQVDPSGLRPAGDPHRLRNLYDFPWNNPLNWRDPSGLGGPAMPILWCLANPAACAAAAAAAAAAVVVIVEVAVETVRYVVRKIRTVELPPPPRDERRECSALIGSSGCAGSPKDGYYKTCTYLCDDGSQCVARVRCTWKGDDPECPGVCYK